MATATKERALTTRPVNTALAVADGVDAKDVRGKENIESHDVTLPRIAVAQKTSPQLEPDKSEYLEGLKLYQLFNTLTGEIYGNGPLEFVIVRQDKRAMQFDENMNIVDFNVPVRYDVDRGRYEDDRLNFHAGDAGKREKPQATLFHEYVVLLADTMEPAVISLKGTSMKAAKALNSFLTFRKGPSWAGKFKVTSASKSAGGFTFAIYKFAPSGAASPELVKQAEEVYEALKGREVHTDRDGADETVSDDDTAPF